MSDFRRQLKEDFDDYRNRYPHVQNIDKDEWALNFWVLDKLFRIDEDVIETSIIDYNDKGIDCFVWHEDLKDLYLIQNKYYSDGTKLTENYVMNDFLTRAIGALEKGTYTRSKELQDIYNKYSMDDEFCIHFHLYVTNNTSKTQKLTDSIALFNKKYASKKYDAAIFYLDDIQELYYKEPLKDKNSFKFRIKTKNDGTILNVDNEAYKMTLALDARYVLTPVIVVYEMVKEAKEKKYPLFEENIRDYLGSTGSVNKKIVSTLKDPQDRANFFFYNNGVTMIVSDMSARKTSTEDPEFNRVFDVIDPQIVNGCQTVNSIYETLSSLPESTLSKDFNDTYVMIKILKIPKNEEKLKALYKNIVLYNNSQNSINEKTFVAIKDEFKHVQWEFENRGFLVCIKQSDKNTFNIKYKSATPLLNINSEDIKKFGLEGYSKPRDFMIELEKLLQVFLAFLSSPQDAIQNKSKLLNEQKQQNAIVVDFIKGNKATNNDIYNLLLLYLRAEQEKKKSNDGKMPNPFYLVHCFARYECKNDPSKISGLLSDSSSIDAIIKKYTLVIKRYYKEWKKKNVDKEYNDMIKATLDVGILDDAKDQADDLLSVD